MNNQRKIHIGGAFYGMHNVGDEAVLYSIIREFSKTYQISTSSYDSKWLLNYFPNIVINPINATYTKPKMGISVFPRKQMISNVKKIIDDWKLFSSIDDYICGGGTILSDCPWHALKTVEMAGRLEKNIILWGVGMADNTDYNTRLYIKKVLNKPYVTKIFARDEFVYNRLNELGITEEKLTVSYDPAILLEGREFSIRDYLSDREINVLNNGFENICISVSGEMDIAEKTPIGEICEFIKVILKKDKYNLFLVPTGCGDHCQDRKLLHEIKNYCLSDRVVMVEREFEPEFLVQFLKNFKFSISSRLHMNIFSACAGIPSIGLIRNSKIVDFAKIFDFPVLQIRNLKTSDLMDAVCILEDKYCEYKADILSKVKFMRERQISALKEVERLWPSLK